jgi:t-SNARE complex subunit (syntaxin)
MESSIRDPLLNKIDPKRQIEQLNIEFNKVMTSLNEIESDIDRESINSLGPLNVKLGNVQQHMEIINNQIHFLRSCLTDLPGQLTKEESELIVNRIRVISEDINRKYENVNKKFEAKLKQAKSEVQLQLNNYNTDIERPQQAQQQITGKTRMEIEQLKNRQEDLEKIEKISFQLLLISRDMKKEAEKSGQKVSNIEDYIISSQNNIQNGTNLLNNQRATEGTRNSFYFWIALIVFIILIGLIVTLLYKYFYYA